MSCIKGMAACTIKTRLIPVRLYNLRTCQLGNKGKRGDQNQNIQRDRHQKTNM